jgi:hypothetical protein
MTEVEELKAQLIAVLSLSQAVDATDNWQDRKHALEEMHAVIQEASPILLHYAADLMVLAEDIPEAKP